MLKYVAVAVTLLVVSVPISADEPDILIADFERVDYGDWQVTGAAFGPGPARGTLPNQMEVTGYEGERLVNSYFKGDGTTGTLTSAPFKIERKYINFLIGQLQVESQVIHFGATGEYDFRPRREHP